MDNRKRYDSNPLRFLIVARGWLLSEYLWYSWIIIDILIGILICHNIIDINLVKIEGFVDASIAGLSFTLIVVSAALEIFKESELKELYKHKKDGQLLLEVLVPYVFTSMLFLGLGIISSIAPLVTISFPLPFVQIIKYLYFITVILGMISLFNVCYDIIINIFNSVRRSVILDDNKKR